MFSNCFKHCRRPEDDQSGETSFSLAIRGLGERRGAEGTLVGLGAGLGHETQQCMHNTVSSWLGYKGIERQVGDWESEEGEGQEEINLLLVRNFLQRKCSKMIIFGCFVRERTSQIKMKVKASCGSGEAGGWWL